MAANDRKQVLIPLLGFLCLGRLRPIGFELQDAMNDAVGEQYVELIKLVMHVRRMTPVGRAVFSVNLER